MHHIFFPPGLAILTLQHEPDRLGTDLPDDALVHRFLGEKLQCPTCSAVGGLRAGKSGDLRLVFSGEDGRLAGARGVVERALQTARAVALADVGDVHRRALEMVGDLLIFHVRTGLEEDPGALNDA